MSRDYVGNMPQLYTTPRDKQWNSFIINQTLGVFQKYRVRKQLGLILKSLFIIGRLHRNCVIGDLLGILGAGDAGFSPVWEVFPMASEKSISGLPMAVLSRDR